MKQFKLKNKLVSNLSQPFLDSANEILAYTRTPNLEYPAIFKGIKEEGEIIRFEWLGVGTHTVLVINDDESFYGFHLNLNPHKEDSFIGKLSEAMSFLNTYIKEEEIK